MIRELIESFSVNIVAAIPRFFAAICGGVAFICLLCLAGCLLEGWGMTLRGGLLLGSIAVVSGTLAAVLFRWEDRISHRDPIFNPSTVCKACGEDALVRGHIRWFGWLPLAHFSHCLACGAREKIFSEAWNALPPPPADESGQTEGD